MNSRTPMDHRGSLPANSDSPQKRRRIELFDDSGFVEADVFGHQSSSDSRGLKRAEGSTSSELFVSVVCRDSVRLYLIV
jgi:hypothetical protein